MSQRLAFAALVLFAADAGAGRLQGRRRPGRHHARGADLAGRLRQPQQAQRGCGEQAEREGARAGRGRRRRPSAGAPGLADAIEFGTVVTEPLAAQVGKEFGVPRDRFLLVGSHSHAAPVVRGVLATMHELAGKDAEAVKEYTRRFESQALAAVRAAMKDLQPAALRYGVGKAGIAANRRAFGPNGVNFGVNPDGAGGPRRPGAAHRRPDGKVTAVLFGYACHCTTLGGDWYKHLRRLGRRTRRSTSKPPSPAQPRCS